MLKDVIMRGPKSALMIQLNVIVYCQTLYCSVGKCLEGTWYNRLASKVKQIEEGLSAKQWQGYIFRYQTKFLIIITMSSKFGEERPL